MSTPLRFLAASAVFFFSYSCGHDGERKSTGDGDESTEGGTGGADGSGGSGSTSEPGEPLVLPGTLEAEHYVRFSESDGMQQGTPSCVSEVNFSVDVGESGAASGGCFIGWAAAGEWLEYDIVVEEDGAFDFTFAISTLANGQILSLVIDEVTRGTVAVTPNDGTFFEDFTLPGVGLEAGEHSVRIVFSTGGLNLDAVRIAEAAECVPACADKACGDDFCGGDCGACEGAQICSSAYQCVDPFVLPVSEYGNLRVEDGQLVSEEGDPVQLRGVSTQWLNWEATYSGNADNMRFMRDDWGLEVYRIANGVEGYNGYLDTNVREERYERVVEIIQHAIDLDLYVLVDWHTHEIEHKELAEEFFSSIAQEFGDKPNVIYEIFNEPIGENDSAVFWENELKPYHEDLIDVIRAHDPDNIIVLGTPLWDQRVDIAAADPVVGENLLYALHFYSCSHGGWLRARAQAALETGIGLFVTEWGSTHSDGGTPNNPGVCLEEATRWHDFLDENKISSTAWKLAADPDSSSILRTGAPPIGPWGEEHLTEHGLFVRERVQR
jgi:hypothetical protein